MTIKYLTKNQVDKLFSVVSDPRDKAMLAIMYSYGLRRGEVCNILISDLDFQSNRIHIRPLKGGIEGFHYLPDTIIKLIQDYLVIRSERCKELPNLFISRSKLTKLAGSSIYRIFAKYAKLAELPPELHRPHSIRHSLAVAMISSGKSMTFVQSLLRHKSPASTAIYANIMDDSKIQMQKDGFEFAEYFAKIA